MPKDFKMGYMGQILKLTVGIIGALRLLFLRPSKLKPSNHLCFWISRIPPLPNPSLSVGISLKIR